MTDTPATRKDRCCEWCGARLDSYTAPCYICGRTVERAARDMAAYMRDCVFPEVQS